MKRWTWVLIVLAVINIGCIFTGIKPQLHAIAALFALLAAYLGEST